MWKRILNAILLLMTLTYFVANPAMAWSATKNADQSQSQKKIKDPIVMPNECFICGK